MTVTGVDDSLVDGSQNTAITLSVDDTNSVDNFDPLANQTVSATTTDDDAAGFSVVESSGSTPCLRRERPIPLRWSWMPSPTPMW